MNGNSNFSKYKRWRKMLILRKKKPDTIYDCIIDDMR
jgi:hypothetical protein